MRARSSLCAALLLGASAAGAQAPPLPAPIVVTGRGLADSPAVPAYHSSEITDDALNSAPSGRIEDVLGNVAGFQQFRRSDSRAANPSAQGVTLRAIGGNASSRALVLLDGVPMEHPFFGYVPLSALAPERLGAVRVTHGGGAGAFGAGAVSGTIELTSAGPDEIGVLSASALANNRAETEFSATTAPRLGAGFAMASARWDRGRGFFTTPPAQRVPATVRARQDSWSIALRAVAPLGDEAELQFGALAFDDARTLRFKGADTTSSGQGGNVRLVTRGDWQVDALAYVQARDFSNVVVSATRFVPVLDQHRTPATGIGGKLEVRPPLGDAHVLRLGADVRIADGQMEEWAYSAQTGARTAIRRAGGRNGDLSLYAEDAWTLGRLVLTAGARADRWTIRRGWFRETNGAGTLVTDKRFTGRSGWEPSLRGGALWHAGGGLSLRLAGYTGLRLPTLNELYRPFAVFPVTTQANEALRNERLEGFEGGVEFVHGDGLSLSLTAFDNRLRRAIANVTLSDTLRQRRNVDAIRARGIEAEGSARLARFTLSGSLALVDARVHASGASAALDGMRPAQTAKFAASTTLGWQPRPGWRLATTLRHTSRQFEDDLETDALPATTSLDAFAQVPVGHALSLILRGENLTGERIVTRNQAGSIDLGAPHTIWVGVKLRLDP